MKWIVEEELNTLGNQRNWKMIKQNDFHGPIQSYKNRNNLKSN